MASDPVRDEAERLVAAAIAAVSLAARGLGGAAGSRFGGQGHGFATGSPECCVCPVCRVIAAMRDPSPDLAERLATGAGDLATAVTGLLRNFSRPSGTGANSTDGAGDEFWDSMRRQAQAADSEAEADPWHAATTAASVDPSTTAPVKPMARKAVKKAVKKAAPAPAPAPSPTGVLSDPATGPSPAAPAKKAAKKVAKKATKKATPPAGDTA